MSQEQPRKLGSLGAYFSRAEPDYDVESLEELKRARLTLATGASAADHEGADKENAVESAPDGPPCRCAAPLPSAPRTVQKEGPNKGRRFFVCAHPREQQCSFFEWADAPKPLAPAEAASAVRVCRCSEPAASKTVQKEGANKGRVFFSCPRPRDAACNFFEWADVPAPAPASAAGTQAQAGTQGQATPCYKCNELGHWARDCPSAKKAGAGAGARGVNCYKCGMSGHLANACAADQAKRKWSS